MSTVLFDATKSIKVARKARFGQGLTPYVAQHTFEPYTVSDAEWLLQDEIRRYEAERLERRRIQIEAATADFMALYENGLASF